MVTRRYWDTCCFLGYLKEEEDKIVQCEAGMREAAEGKLEIVTSTITLAETLYLVKDGRPVPAETREKVRRLFENEFILLAEVDRRTAELAQEVVWDHDVAAKDAIHVATAVVVGKRLPIQQLDTFDGPLIERSGKVQGLRIGNPNFQTDLMMDAAENGARTIRDGSQTTGGISPL
ncbi:MAG TPA: PIN domain-containing protein [Solirubrobacterales bacterium]|nr:PIN domain-containing protein [Solirubrobacterales bacterium]